MSIALEVIEHIKNVSGYDIRKETRVRNIVELRVIYAQLLLKNSDLTTKQTGKYINKDHATIIHYRKQFDNFFMYSEFRDLYYKITSNLKLNAKSKKERLEDLGWTDINPLLINDILKIYV